MIYKCDSANKGHTECLTCVWHHGVDHEHHATLSHYHGRLYCISVYADERWGEDPHGSAAENGFRGFKPCPVSGNDTIPLREAREIELDEAEE